MVIIVDNKLSVKQREEAEQLLSEEIEGAAEALDYFAAALPNTYLFNDIDIVTPLFDRIKQVQDLPDGEQRNLLLENIYKYHHESDGGVNDDR